MYEDILLKTYLQIAQSGDFQILIKEGKAATDEQCLIAWEDLIRKQEKATGSNQYNSILQLLKGYAKLINDHTVVRACLVYLLYYPIDWEIIVTLKQYGYAVDTSDPEKLAQSIKAKLRWVENLITKATMKQKEIDRLLKGSEEKKDEKGFEEILAMLNFSLGFNVSEDLTLARYNEYQKILKRRQKEAEEAKNNGRRNGRRS